MSEKPGRNAPCHVAAGRSTKSAVASTRCRNYPDVPELSPEEIESMEIVKAIVVSVTRAGLQNAIKK